MFLCSEAHCCALPTVHVRSDATNMMKDGENRSVYQCHFFRVLNVDIGGAGRDGREYFFSFKEGVVEDCI